MVCFGVSVSSVYLSADTWGHVPVLLFVWCVAPGSGACTHLGGAISGLPGGIMLPAKSGDIRDAGLIPGLGRSLGCEDLLEEGIATHSSIFAWRILWTEEPGGLQSIGSQRVRHD